MKCREALSLLSSYIDDEVSSKEKKRIEAHLGECEECSKTLYELRKTVGLVKEIKEVPMPPELAERIKSDLRKEEKAKRPKEIPEKSREGIFPKRALRYVLVFSGVLAVIIAIVIPLRAFWPLQTETRIAPKSEDSLSAPGRTPEKEQKSKTAGREDESFDSLPAGQKVKETSVNYSKEGVKKLVRFYEEREKEKDSLEVFSSKARDETIASMLNEASELMPDVSHFAQCFEILVSHNGNILPVYAEKTYFQDNEAWIIITKEFSPHEKGFTMRAYVFGTPECKIVYSTD